MVSNASVAAADALSIARHGFSAAHNSWDPTTAIPLSTHLNPETASRSAAGGSTLQLVVCKVCLDGPCKSLSDGGVIDCAVDQPECIYAQQYPGLKAVYRAVGSGSSSSSSSYLRSSSNGKNSRGGPSTLNSSRQQHRLWYVLDHTAILPEYIVTCTVPGTTPATVAPQAQACSSNIADCLESSGCKDALLRVCAQPLSKWLCLGGQQPGQQPGQQDPDAAAQALQARSAEVLAATALAPCPRLPYLTSLGLTVASGGKQLDSLTRLSLQDCGCTSFVGLLSHLPSLVVLALPFNKLTSLDGLAQSAPSNKLAELDVSHNRLTTWCTSWLIDCTALTSLDASCNPILQPADLQPLVRSAPQLQQLHLRSNPVQQHKAYTATLSGLSALSKLDGAAVQQQEQQAGSSCLTSVLRDKATLWHSTSGPVATLHTLGADDWRQLLHTVVLEGQKLRSLQGLSDACNLVAANLADNLISNLAELAGCSKMQRLDVSSNLVLEVQPLSKLVRLHQLDVSCNQISSLSALWSLTALTQLSCESNTISSLADVSSLDNLVELYAAHNNLADIKEAERLSMLARLAVLDLTGNPLVTATDGYRLLLLYKLRSLKVLDGTPTDAAELQAAQGQHAGRLTVGMLEERLGGGCDLASLRHLDLTGIGIKDCGSVFASGGPLVALTSLNLDSNHLTNLAPLAGLTRLVTLSINNNRPWDSSQLSWSFAAPATTAANGVHESQQTAVSVSGSAAAKPLLPSLQVLQLAGCGLASLVPLQLQCLPALRSLFVQGNELSRLDGLEGLVQLRELVADKNRIRLLEPEVFSSLFRLQELRLEDNAIRNINPPVTVNGGMPACFPQLRVLQLSNNRLLDPSDCINRVAVIPTLTELSVTGNPFARKHQAYRQLFIGQCSQLQTIDGQPVTDEERDYVEALATVDSPRFVEVPQYTAATLLAAAAETKTAPPSLPLARLQAAAAHSSAPEVASPKAVYGSQGLPTLGNPLSYEGLASLAAARQALLGSVLPGLLPTSVPSIQSGVLVFTGPASFGLEGTAMRGSSSSPGGSSGTAGSPAASPSKAAGRSQLQQQASPGNTARGNRRTTTGSIASYRAGGFVVRQATFQY